MCDGAVDNNESWTEAAISSPAAEVGRGVLQGVSGRLGLLQRELVTSTLKVEIYVIANVWFGLCLPGCRRAAGGRLAPRGRKRPSFPPQRASTSLPPSPAALCLPHVCSFARGTERDSLLRSLWAEGISCSKIRFR